MAKNGEPAEEIKSFLLRSPKEISELFKTISHSKRLQVLALLMNEDSKPFLSLQHETGMSKTALANHLAQLINKNLIDRIERGSYRITKDGQELLNAAVILYRDSKIGRQKANSKRLKELFYTDSSKAY
ncbi:MAG: ArsR/SmtB family transcription factor [Candidatus Hodarchaeales archaeon]|jgi:DNA-binding HxlR family transcriptional regulator